MSDLSQPKLPTQPNLGELPSGSSRRPFRWPFALCMGAASLCGFAGAYQSFQMETALGWWLATGALTLTAHVLKPHR